MARPGEGHRPQQHHPDPGTLEHRAHGLRGISSSVPGQDVC